MQNYTEIADTQTITDSRVLILNNDKTVMSCNSGTEFPTQNLQVGMLCHRSNSPAASGGLYELVSDAPVTWKLIIDFAQTPLHKEEADAYYAAINHIHSDVIAGGASGFMSGADKQKLDNFDANVKAILANSLVIGPLILS